MGLWNGVKKVAGIVCEKAKNAVEYVGEKVGAAAVAVGAVVTAAVCAGSVHAEEVVNIAMPTGLSFPQLIKSGIEVIGVIAAAVAAAAITFALIKGGISWVKGVMTGK